MFSHIYKKMEGNYDLDPVYIADLIGYNKKKMSTCFISEALTTYLTLGNSVEIFTWITVLKFGLEGCLTVFLDLFTLSLASSIP